MATRSASAGILPLGSFRVLRPLFTAFPNLALIAFSAWSRNDCQRSSANLWEPVFLKLFAGRGGYARLELLGQPDDHIDVAVPTEVGVVLVGALEEYFVLELRQPLVGVQRLSDRYVRLLEGRPSLVMAPPGERGFR